MKVMLIDHDKASRDAHRAMLHKLGYDDVVDAVDGKDGIAKIFRLNPDLIVLERSMPGMDGIEFVKAYRERGGASPVLMMDDSADREKVIEAQKVGVASYVIRPVEPDVLAQRILQTLMKRKSA